MTISEEKLYRDLSEERISLVEQLQKLKQRASELKREFSGYVGKNETCPRAVLQQRHLIGQEQLKVEKRIQDVNKILNPLKDKKYKQDNVHRLKFFYETAKGMLDKETFLRIWERSGIEMENEKSNPANGRTF